MQLYWLLALIVPINAFVPFQKTNLRRLLSKASDISMAASAPKKVLVLGGDGFCGWPTSLYLSDQGILNALLCVILV